MVVSLRRLVIFISLSLVALLGIAVFAPQMGSPSQYPGGLLAGLRWRDVGPMRGGRSYAVAGHADQPDTFYMGSVGGGVYSNNDQRLDSIR